MKFNLNAWLFRSSSFCCCIPVRAGVVLMTVVTFLLSGAISIIIWFEIFHSFQYTTKERVAFFLAGIVESFLFILSAVGFIGVVACKQLFVMVYAYFLYVHFVLNVIVGVYFLVTVRQSNRQELVDYCSKVSVNTSLEWECSRLMNVSTYVFIAIVAALLLFELYGTLIVTRYVYRLRLQKRENRSRRLGYFHALSVPESSSTRHTRQASDNIELLHPQENIGDLQDSEDVVLDIGPESYMPVSTHDRDAPPVASPPYSLTDTSSARRVRALPPRPVAAVSPEMTSRAQEVAALPEMLPNPHGPTSCAFDRRASESDDERRSLYTSEVSTSAHAALMDHANYLESRFSPVPPLPNVSQRSLR